MLEKMSSLQKRSGSLIIGNDDLYHDLDTNLNKVPAKKKKAATTDSSSSSRYYLHTDDGGEESAREENKILKERIHDLEEENIRLKRNIGTLFRTAKNEIYRKDGQIQRLKLNNGC